MSLDVAKFNLSFDAKAGLEAVKDNAVETVKTAATDAIVSALISGGAAKETAATTKRGATTAADAVKTTQQLQQQKQLCSTALNTIIQLVQTGELDISQFQNILKNQIIQTIKDNNTKGETLQESIQELTNRNEEIKQQIAELNGGSLDGIEFEEVKTDSSGGNTPSTDNNTSTDGNKKSSSTKKVVKSGNNSNAEQIQKLLEEYNKNIGMLSSLQVEYTNIQTEQTVKVQEGEQVQSQAEQKHSEIVNNTQTAGQNLFQKISDSINKLFGGGKAKQLGHQATGLTMTTADTTAGTIKSTEAAAAGTGSLFSFGATSGIAAKAAAEAAAFFSAATQNTVIAGQSLSNIAALATGQQTVGNFVAQQITNEVNNQLSGAITQLTNEVLGEDVAKYVAPELANLAQIEAPKENQA